MAMLSIRTTLKPDVGASPSDLVYGEGLAVPGELLPSTPPTDPQLARQREEALSELRMEVARLQPVPTSTHRQPRIHLPPALETCSHVFIRRAPVAPSPLSAPYVGPFRVLSRNRFNFVVNIPGRGDETVSISRVKPAVSSEEDADAAAPPPRRRQRPLPPYSPPIRRPAPRVRARQLHINDEEMPEPLRQPDLTDDPLEIPLDNNAPQDWAEEEDVHPPLSPPAPRLDTPPPQRQLFEDRVDAQTPSEQPEEHFPHPPPPRQSEQLPPEPVYAPHPPPQRRNRKRRQGNPNWVRGGSFAGARWKVDPPPPAEDPAPQRTTRPRPDVTAIFAHLDIPMTSPSTHACSGHCDSINYPN